MQFAGDTQGAIVRTGTAGFESVVQKGMFGPEGGRISSVGRPSVNGAGQVATRVGFEPFTGGAAGVFVVDKKGMQPFIRIGEGGAAGIEGRITSLNQNVSLNGSGRMAFLASIGGGAGSAIFLAAPAPLGRRGSPSAAGPARRRPIRPRNPRSDQHLRRPRPAALPGHAYGRGRAHGRARRADRSDGRGPKGTVWTATLPAKDTQLRGRTLRKKHGPSESQIASLRVQFARNGTIRVALRSKRIDLSTTAQGIRNFEKDAVVLVPPFTVRIDAGEDGSSSVIPCNAKSRRFTCHGP